MAFDFAASCCLNAYLFETGTCGRYYAKCGCFGLLPASAAVRPHQSSTVVLVSSLSGCNTLPEHTSDGAVARFQKLWCVCPTEVFCFVVYVNSRDAEKVGVSC